LNHLESLIAEYYDWKGYLVKKNLKVGKLSHGGWEMELDIIAFNPITQHLIHIEPSIDAYSWEIRESRFKKKFESGEKYMFSNVFPWLDENTPVERIIVLPAHSAGRDYLCGAKIFSLDEFMLKIKNDIMKCGKMARNAIPEQYPLLRTIQLVTNGYYRPH